MNQSEKDFIREKAMEGHSAEKKTGFKSLDERQEAWDRFKAKKKVKGQKDIFLDQDQRSLF